MFSARTCRCIIVSAVVVLPLLIAAAITVETNTDDIDIWLPQGTPQRASYDQFIEQFGPDDEIIFSWEGCTTTDPRLPQLIGGLRASNRELRLFSSLISGDAVIDELVSQGFGYQDSQLRRRLAGIFLDPRTGTTAVIAQLSDVGRRNGRQCIDEIYRQTDSIPGLNRDDLRIGGNTFTTTEIDKATNRSLWFAFPAACLAALTTLVCLGNVRLTLATLLVAGYSALLSIALVSLFGFKVNGLLVMMPILVLVLGLSAAVHLCSYYMQAIQESADDPVTEMLRTGWRPCAFALLTTAVGVAMLLTSHIEAVRTFGMFSSLGVLSALLCVLTIFPAVLRIWPCPVREKERICRRADRLTFPVPSVVTARHRWLATAVSIIFLAASPMLIFGLSRVKSTLQTEKMFSRQSVVNRDSQWLTQRFSAVKNIEVIATFKPASSDRLYVDQIRKLKALQQDLSQVEHVQSVFSVATVTRLPSNRRNARNVLQTQLIEDALQRHTPSLIDRRLLAVAGNSYSWRIRVGVDLDDDAGYDDVISDIQRACDRVSARMVGGPSCRTTGIWALTTAGRDQVFSDLATSFMLAFAIITPLVILVLRGLILGLVAMIPNVMPAAIFFGVAGLSGIEIDIGTLLTASVGLGIAVDDTLHFLHGYRRRRHNGMDREAATLRTIRGCFRPMLYTTLICSFGLCFFAFSEFLPARQFALAIVCLMITALVCDLVLLPALILSPIGRVFERPARAGRLVVEPAVVPRSAIDRSLTPAPDHVLQKNLAVDFDSRESD